MIHVTRKVYAYKKYYSFLVLCVRSHSSTFSTQTKNPNSSLNKIGKQNPQLSSGENGNGDDDGNSPDMTALVSALANQQSEEDLSMISQCGSDNSYSGNDHGPGGLAGGGGAGGGGGGGGFHIPKDLHNLSRMFIQANLLPRPRSYSNFQAADPDKPFSRFRASFHKSESRLFHGGRSGGGGGGGGGGGHSPSPPTNSSQHGHHKRQRSDSTVWGATALVPGALPAFLAPPLLPILAVEPPHAPRSSAHSSQRKRHRHGSGHEQRHHGGGGGHHGNGHASEGSSSEGHSVILQAHPGQVESQVTQQQAGGGPHSAPVVVGTAPPGGFHFSHAKVE